MTVHELKCHPPYFQAVKRGDKPFELREYDPETQQYTGDLVNRRVTYVLAGGPWLGEGYVAMGLQEVRV